MRSMEVNSCFKVWPFEWFNLKYSLHKEEGILAIHGIRKLKSMSDTDKRLYIAIATLHREKEIRIFSVKSE